MSRGYRSFVFAAFGCLIVAAIIGWFLQPEKPHLAGDRGYQEQAASYRAGGGKCEPANLERLSGRERIRKADACQEAGEQHREAANSLIEARRTADAADASVVLAYKQTEIAGWGAAIGIVTLFAALGAAVFAERAAHHSKRSADTEEKAHEASIERDKPRLVVTLTDFDDSNALARRFNITATNVGGSGCVVTQCFHSWGARDNHPEIMHGLDAAKAIAVGQSVVLDPITLPITQPMDQRVLLVRIGYEGPFLGKKEQWVGFGFHVFPEITYPHMTHYMPLDPGYADRQRSLNDDNSERADG